MIDLCQEVLYRVNRTCPYQRWTDDGNIIYGMLVVLWGDYGTSPRGGWLENNVDEITYSINRIMKEFKEMEEIQNV